MPRRVMPMRWRVTGWATAAPEEGDAMDDAAMEGGDAMSDTGMEETRWATTG